MTEEENIQRIDDFLNNRLPAEVSSAFQKELSQNPALADEVEMHRLMQTGIVEDAGIEKLKLHLQALENEYISANPRHVAPQQDNRTLKKSFTHTPVFRWMAGVAATIFIATLGYFMLMNQSGTGKLYSEYYQRYPMAEVLPAAGRGSNLQTDKEKALQFYENERYKEAIQLLEPFVQKHPDEVAASFYLGAAYLQVNKTAEASMVFKNIADRPANDYTDPARWYLALSHLKGNEPQKARAYLNILAQQKGEFSERARSLLEKI